MKGFFKPKQEEVKEPTEMHEERIARLREDLRILTEDYGRKTALIEQHLADTNKIAEQKAVIMQLKLQLAAKFPSGHRPVESEEDYVDKQG